jgi:copper(I)-binding protein
VNRALRAATMGVLLLFPVALSACSAGQVTQTATQERDKTGAQAQVGDLTLRQAQLQSPRGGSYGRGDDAELQLAVINGGTEADALVGVHGDGFESAEIRSSAAGTPTPTQTATGSQAPGNDKIEIPAGESVYVGRDGNTVTLTNLREPLTPGQYLEVTFTFERAGEVTIPVTVATPGNTVDRGETFDFHQEEGAGGTTHG